MNNARCGDEFICRIGIEIKFGGRAANRDVERPDMDSREYPGEFRIVQVDGDSVQLTELRYFPQNNGRHSPRFGRQQTLFSGSQSTFKSVNQYVSIKIQHSI